MSELDKQIAAYLAYRMPNAGDMAVDEVARVAGGASQEMFRFRARWREAGEAVERRFILRREPAGGLVEAERDLEFKVYQALAGSGIPVPTAHFLELDGKWLERAFFIMDLAPGKPGHFYVAGDPYEGHGESIARSFWRHLGALARIDHKVVGLQTLRNGAHVSGFAAAELAHWSAMLDKNELHPEPIVRGALRKLLSVLPPSRSSLQSCTGTIAPAIFSSRRMAKYPRSLTGKWLTSAIP